MTKFWQTGIGILAVFILVCGVSDVLLGKKTQQDSAANPAQESKKALPVKAVKIKKAKGTRYIDYPGIVLTDNQSELSFRVSGMIQEMPIKVGQVLKKGQLLARLDNSHYLNAREQALAAKRRAMARMRDARKEYQRLKELKAARDISKRKLQRAQTAAKAAEENHHIAQKRLAEAERQLGYTVLQAPFDGVVASKKVHAFQTIAAGQPIALMVNSSDLLFRVQLPASVLPDKNDFEKFECVFPALNDLKIEARLHGIGPSALPPLHTCPLTVELDSAAKHGVTPGTEGILRIAAAPDESENRVLIPVSAVTSDHKGRPQVWIANPKTGRADQRPVKLHGLDNGKMAVESGLSDGEWVITAGQTHLSPGRKIKIVQPESKSQ